MVSWSSSPVRRWKSWEDAYHNLVGRAVDRRRPPQGTPMMLLRRPSDATIQDFLATQVALDFTYPAVGATASVPPAGYVVDHTRIGLGEGEAAFRAARAALGR